MLTTQLSRSSLAVCLALLALVEPGRTQVPATAGSAAPPPSGDAPASSTPPGPEVPAPSPGAAPTDPTSVSPSECVPACRTGYVCVQNQCVSACNPPCVDGETCVGQGQCVTACNPACLAGQHCVSPGRCAWNTSPAPVATDSDAYPVAEEYEEKPAKKPRKGKKLHDGFYLRMGVGVGILLGSAKASDPPSEEATGPVYDEVDSVGVAIPLELAVGGTPAPGFAIGFGSYPVHVPAASYSAGRGDYAVEERAGYGAMTMYGPFFDYYIDPKRGLHIELAPSVVTFLSGKSGVIAPESQLGMGWGVLAGVGMESWISDQWGIGVLGRVQYVSVKLKHGSDSDYDFIALVPGVLLTFTFH